MSGGVRPSLPLLAWITAIGATWAVLAVTQRHGVGASLDSVVYAETATSFVTRRTLDVPLTWWDSDTSRAPLSHFPPLLPLALAAIGEATGVSPYVAARWLNAACIFSTLLLATLPIATSPFALFVAWALLVGPSFMTNHWWLWSEPLFLSLSLASMRIFAAGPFSRARFPRPVLLGVCCGLATLTRYAGVSLFLGFALLLLCSKASSGARLRRLLGYGVAYAATVAPWVWWLAVVGGAPRTLGFYTEDAWSGVVVPLGGTLVRAMVPLGMPLPAGILTLCAGALVVARAWIASVPRGSALPVGPTTRTAAVLLAVNVVFLLLVRLFVDAGIPMDERILSSAVLFLAVALSDVAKSAFPRGLPLLPSLLVGCVTLGNFVATVPQAAHAARHGLGYLAEPWRSSETLAWLRHAPRELTLFSNAPDAICASLPVAAKYTPSNTETARLGEFAARVERAVPAAIVLFDDPHAGWLMPRDRLREHLRLPHEVRVFSDGVVLVTRSP